VDVPYSKLHPKRYKKGLTSSGFYVILEPQANTQFLPQPQPDLNSTGTWSTNPACTSTWTSTWFSTC
jgi:hypothetical protein